MTQLAQDLQNLKLTVLQINQSWGSMSPPSKEFERLILEGKVVHGANPVTRWMIDNVVVRIDPAGNIRPDKERSNEKIDGVVAAIMALDRAQRMEKHRGSRRVVSY
jgi:phage terminase large subunit-like protein